MALFQRLLTQSSVTRPAVLRSSDDEADWIAAGAKSASHVPVNKIIVSQKSTPPEQVGATVQEFVSDRFWEGFSNPRLVGREVAAQEQVLRAICTHSDWLLMRLPQIRGGSDDEIVTVKQIIRLSNLLPAGFRKSAIDLHVCTKRSLSEHTLAREISSELNPLVRKGVRIHLSVYPEGHFVNRELLGGECTRTSSGDIKYRPLWWITMTHVAVGSRTAANAGEAGNTWSVFPRQMAYERHEQMVRESPLRVEVLQ